MSTYKYLPHSTLANAARNSSIAASHTVKEIEFLLTTIKQYQVVAFRGTEHVAKDEDGVATFSNILDIVRDIRVAPYKCKTTGVVGHAGFLKGGEDVADVLEFLVDKETPLILTGHSMGGAIAISASFILKARGYNIAETVAFGSPFVYYTKHKPDFDMTLYRYGRDLVTYVPFGRHPVKVTQLGKGWLPNLKDHKLALYHRAIVREKL